ncbi:hypothetical protein [Streptomyces sp. NPDC007369]|uniref:hypothetical protein n=1 Tax=Streptomyces sp. NPDC007369 TaxID=3154589 RepID=UPI003402C4FA
MASATTRRLVPLLIATAITAGGISLITTTAATAAPTAPTAPTGVTTDGDSNPLVDSISRIPMDDDLEYSGGSDGGVVTKDPNTASLDLPPYAASESRTDDARPGPVMDDTPPTKLAKLYFDRM